MFLVKPFLYLYIYKLEKFILTLNYVWKVWRRKGSPIEYVRFDSQTLRVVFLSPTVQLTSIGTVRQQGGEYC